MLFFHALSLFLWRELIQHTIQFYKLVPQEIFLWHELIKHTIYLFKTDYLKYGSIIIKSPGGEIMD
jgi:hypothetical protein